MKESFWCSLYSFIDFEIEDGGKSRKMLGFAHREVARKDKKSVKIDLFSLDKKSRKSPI